MEGVRVGSIYTVIIDGKEVKEQDRKEMFSCTGMGLWVFGNCLIRS